MRNPNDKCWEHGYAERKVGMRQIIFNPKTLKEVVDSLIDPDGYEKLNTTGYIYCITDDYILDSIISVYDAMRILKIEQL